MLKLTRIAMLFVLLAVLSSAIGVHAQDAFEYGDLVEGELTADTSEVSYTFTGAEGDVIVVDIEPAAENYEFSSPILILTGPDDEAVFDLTEAFTVSYMTIGAELPADGDYTLTITRAADDTTTLGGFAFVVHNAEVLEAGTPLSGEVESEGRNRFYTVQSPEEFSLMFNKTGGDMDIEVTLQEIIEDDTLRDVAMAGGDDLETIMLGAFDADTRYVIEVGEPLFSFASDVTAEFDLEIAAAEAQ